VDPQSSRQQSGRALDFLVIRRFPARCDVGLSFVIVCQKQADNPESFSARRISALTIGRPPFPGRRPTRPRHQTRCGAVCYRGLLCVPAQLTHPYTVKVETSCHRATRYLSIFLPGSSWSRPRPHHRPRPIRAWSPLVDRQAHHYRDVPVTALSPHGHNASVFGHVWATGRDFGAEIRSSEMLGISRPLRSEGVGEHGGGW
jgi:hypothetical protein